MFALSPAPTVRSRYGRAVRRSLPLEKGQLRDVVKSGRYPIHAYQHDPPSQSARSCPDPTRAPLAHNSTAPITRFFNPRRRKFLEGIDRSKHISAPLYLPSRRNNTRSRIPASPAGHPQRTFAIPGVLPALTGRLPNHKRSKFDQAAACQASNTCFQPTRAMVLPSSSVKFSGPRKVMYNSLSSSNTV